MIAGIPKNRMQCYEGLATFIKKQNNIIMQEILQDKGQIKKTKTDSAQ